MALQFSILSYTAPCLSLNIDDNESIVEICRKANISVQTYYKYIKDPDLAKLINAATTNVITTRKPLAIRALLRQAEKGNIAAIRTVLEIDGTLGVGNRQVVNVGVTTQPTHETKDYDSPAEAIADIDKTIVELKAYRASIVDKQADRLKGHGIHPPTENDHHEQV